jgi:hypothetical protein
MTSFSIMIQVAAKSFKLAGKLAIIHRYTVTSVAAVLAPANS